MIQAFAYSSPSTLNQAIDSLSDAWGKVDLLAGGTDLLALMKEGIETPKTVVDIKRIAGLQGIDVVGSGIRIGATTTLDDLARHSVVRRHLPALAAAAAAIGGPQIRNRATIGGNLCQRPRDWYFRNGLFPEVRAETQYSAIFPEGEAIYVHPSTLAPPLIAYDAMVNVTGPDGDRSLPVAEFFQVSDLKEKRETVLAPNEVVTAVTVPVDDGCRSAEYEVRERQSHDWPLVQVAVCVALDGDKVDRAKVVLGHVGPTPIRSRAAEKALKGKTLTAAAAAAAGKAAAEGANPLGKNDYKVALTQVAVKRALLAAVGAEYWRSGA